MAFKFEGRRPKATGLGLSSLIHIIIRFIQIIFACVVIGYYASDLNAANKVNKYADSKWIFGVLVGSMSAITALVLGVISFFSQYHTIAILFAWEWLLVILWIALSGMFGIMYLNENPEMDHGIEAMRIAAIFDLVNMILWMITATAATIVFFRSPRKSLHTGRANL